MASRTTTLSTHVTVCLARSRRAQIRENRWGGGGGGAITRRTDIASVRVYARRRRRRWRQSRADTKPVYL